MERGKGERWGAYGIVPKYPHSFNNS